jgi:rod shape determining protein RodA
MARETSLPDLFILISTVLLIIIGLMANYSTSFSSGSAEFTHFERQLIWSGIGLLVLVVALVVPIRYMQTLAYIGFGVSLLLLVAVLVAGKIGMGATRWLGVGVFRFQPSELAKLATILGLARFLSDFPRDIGRPWVTLVAIAMALIPMGLILVEPDLGTSLVFPVLLFCMLAWAGIPGWHLLLLLCPVIAILTSWHQALHYVALLVTVAGIYFSSRKLMPVVSGAVGFLFFGSVTTRLWGHLHGYQQKRILTFLDPESDPLGSAYQLIQSKIAIGSGGITGKGFLKGTQTQLDFLPEGHTDFVFSAWAEEFGFIGSILVAILLLTLFIRGIQYASRCHNSFNSLLAVGIVCTLAFQSLTNLLMTVGLLPVTGLPLPFISYGGSSLSVILLMSGLLLSISMRWREY